MRNRLRPVRGGILEETGSEGRSARVKKGVGRSALFFQYEGLSFRPPRADARRPTTGQGEKSPQFFESFEVGERRGFPIKTSGF